MIHDQQLLNEFHSLPSDKQTEVIDFIQRLKLKQAKSSALGKPSLLELQGLGKELWQAVDVDTYLDQERNSWD